MNLVIVESPAKARTISKFLGKNFRVKASMGHLVDLPKSQLGIEIENNFSPKYITIRGKGKILKELKESSKKSRKVYLATDPDREGEAISWHLVNSLDIKEDEPCRVEFHEITREAIKDAFSKPRPLDKNKIDAQQARRVLDRLVGYLLSPLLWDKVRKGLSAGRVQSVALRLICDREKEIEVFIPEEYWNIEGSFKNSQDKEIFTAKFYGKEKKKIVLNSQEEVNHVLEGLQNKKYVVKKVQTTEKKRHPSPPFITSTLQQEASRKLGFTSKKTMMLAQQLYEGIEVGQRKEAVGLITYIRTDSTKISSVAQEDAADLIKRQFGADFLPAKPRNYASRKSAQEAHEAIRPTSVSRDPDAIKRFLSRDQYKLYKLIWERFLASQMQPALIEQVKADILGGQYLFKASGSKIIFPGFMAVYIEGEDDETEKEKQLPLLEEGQELILLNLQSSQHFTQPPPRYSEASLIKTMENKGIGRPSTYSPTIDTILNRGYVVREQKAFKPTELGFIVVDILKKYFPEIIDISFTAQMEDKLDRVEAGEIPWRSVLKDFYPAFRERLQEAKEKMEKVALEDEETDEKCPSCGKNLVKKHGRYGVFLACPGFPDCRYTMPLKVDTGVKCPLCQGDIVERKSKKGRKFYGCSNYPECNFISWNKPVDKKCPTCGYLMVEKRGRKKKTGYQCGNKDCGHQEQKESKSS